MFRTVLLTAGLVFTTWAATFQDWREHLLPGNLPALAGIWCILAALLCHLFMEVYNHG